MNEALLLPRMRDAANVVGIAQQHSWPVPTAYNTALRTANAANQLSMNPPMPAMPEPPTKPEDVERWCTKIATARITAAETAKVAGELRNRVAGDLVDIVRRAVPDYIDRLSGHFADTADRLGELLPTAPTTLSGHESADQLSQHAELLRIAQTLAIAAAHRVTLAVFIGEHENLERNSEAWYVLDPTKASSIGIDGVVGTISAYRDRMPNTVAEWVNLQQQGLLSIAGPNEAAQRADLYGRVLYRRGLSDPSRGQHPALYSAWVDRVNAAA
jgi:hypothetical protein